MLNNVQHFSVNLKVYKIWRNHNHRRRNWIFKKYHLLDTSTKQYFKAACYINFTDMSLLGKQW